MTDVQYYKGKVLSQDGNKYAIELEGTKKTVTVKKEGSPTEYKTGTDIIVAGSKDSSYYITGYNRVEPLAWLFVVFALVSVLVAKKNGLFSLLGLIFSFLIIFKVTLPMLLSGTNPILTSLLTVAIIAPVTFSLSHGIGGKTLTALIGTLSALFATALIALLFTSVTNLTGFGSEEAMFLQLQAGDISIKGLLLCGIIIGTLGILDDVTISQASIVEELKRANVRLTPWDLYTRAMRVGRDHISSAVNTLVLVYTGASLPLLLLFIKSPLPTYALLSYDMIAEEIVTTLVSSVGLILAVPITTLIAAYRQTNG